MKVWKIVKEIQSKPTWVRRDVIQALLLDKNPEPPKVFLEYYHAVGLCNGNKREAWELLRSIYLDGLKKSIWGEDSG